MQSQTIRLSLRIIKISVNIMSIIIRRYSIAALLNYYSAETQHEMKQCLALLLNISPQMLSLYINARQGETDYSMSSDKLEKVRKFFGLKTISEVMTTAPNVDASVFNSFQKGISV